MTGSEVKKGLLSKSEGVTKLSKLSSEVDKIKVDNDNTKLSPKSENQDKTINSTREGGPGEVGMGQVIVDSFALSDSSKTIKTNKTISTIKTIKTITNTPYTLLGDLKNKVISLLFEVKVGSYKFLSDELGYKNNDAVINAIRRNSELFSEMDKKEGIKQICLSALGIEYIENKIKEQEKQKEEINLRQIKESERLDNLSDVIQKAKQFLLAYKKQLGSQIKQGKNNIVVNFTDLSEFSIDLSDKVIEDPEVTIKALESSSLDLFSMEDIKVRIINIPKDRKVFIENLRSKHIGKLISVEGRVVSISDVRPQVVNAKFECPSCGTIISVLQIEKKFREPSRCSCGRRGGFKLIHKEMVNTSRIILEDLQEKTDNPHSRRLNIFISRDLTFPENIKMFTPGNEVKVVGVLKEVPVPLQGGGLSTRFELALEVNSVELSEEEVDVTKLSDEEIEEIKDVSSKIDIHGLEEINSSFAPDIYGHEEIKNAIILQLCNQRNLTHGGVARNKPNILLIGDPGSAKSVLGNFAVNITPGARKVTGGGSSAVGITASVIREDDGWRVEPGAFVLAKDLLFIDELNNLQDEDKPKLQEAMSEQSVTIAKANIRMKMKVTAGALATANPIRGVFKTNESMVSQFNLPAPIINRFDEIFVIRDIVDEETDRKIAEKMINRERGKIKSKYSKDFLKMFFVYIKQLDEPIIEDNIAEKMKQLYAKIRKSKTDEININPRFKETLIRLGKASAKIRMSHIVEEKDIERAINILSKSYYGIPDYKTFQQQELFEK